MILEAIPLTESCQYMLGEPMFLLQFLPQPGDMDIHGALGECKEIQKIDKLLLLALTFGNPSAPDAQECRDNDAGLGETAIGTTAGEGWNRRRCGSQNRPGTYRQLPTQNASKRCIYMLQMQRPEQEQAVGILDVTEFLCAFSH